MDYGKSSLVPEITILTAVERAALKQIRPIPYGLLGGDNGCMILILCQRLTVTY